MKIKIEQLKVFSSGTTREINSLLAQLNPSSKILSRVSLGEIIKEKLSHLLVARESDTNKIVGMLTLIIFRIPFAKKGLLEDIVVDKDYRGKGIGTKLISNAINLARREGVARLDFTSSPKRVAANSFYDNLGFKKRDTNVYRIEL